MYTAVRSGKMGRWGLLTGRVRGGWPRTTPNIDFLGARVGETSRSARGGSEGQEILKGLLPYRVKDRARDWDA